MSQPLDQSVFLRLEFAAETIRARDGAGRPVPVEFVRASPAWSKAGRRVEAGRPQMEAGRRGPGIFLGRDTGNLLSPNQSRMAGGLEGFTALGEASVAASPEAGWGGPGALRVEAPVRDSGVELAAPPFEPLSMIHASRDLKEVLALGAVRVRGAGRVRLCLADEANNEIGLVEELELSADWRSLCAALLLNADAAEVRLKLRLSAYDRATIMADGFQVCTQVHSYGMAAFLPRYFTPPPWCPGGATRARDSLWVDLGERRIPRSGTAAFWVRPDWRPETCSHTFWQVNSGLFEHALSGGPTYQFHAGLKALPTETNYYWTGRRNFAAGRWHQIVATWDAAGRVAQYLDGLLLSSTIQPPQGILKPEVLGRRLAIGMPLQDRDPDYAERLDGVLDEFVMYDRALTKPEVEALYWEGTPEDKAAPREIALVQPRQTRVVSRHEHPNWMPNRMVRFPDGEIFLRHSAGPDTAPRWKRQGTSGKNNWRSRDDGKSWAAVSPRLPAGIGGGVHLVRGNELWIGPNWQRAAGSGKDGLSGKMGVSFDKGDSWEARDVRLHIPADAPTAGAKSYGIGRIIERAGGGFLGAGEVSLPNGGGGVCCYRSDDGIVWHYQGLICNGACDVLAGNSYNEHALIEGRAGLLVCVFRTGGHNTPLRRAFSFDNGLTWTREDLSGCAGIYPTLLRLDPDTLALVTGRPDVTVSLSRDGGLTWGPQIPLIDCRELPLPRGNSWYGSTTYNGSAVMFSPRRLLVAYDRTHRISPPEYTAQDDVVVTEVDISCLTDYAAGVRELISCESAAWNFKGKWEGTAAYRSTADGQAAAEVEFEGTGVVLLHPIGPDGGMLAVELDGQPASSLSLYNPYRHTLMRSPLARGLPHGRHMLRLTVDLSGRDRHYYEPGVEAERFACASHLAGYGAERWVTLSGLEVLR